MRHSPKTPQTLYIYQWMHKRKYPKTSTCLNPLNYFQSCAYFGGPGPHTTRTAPFCEINLFPLNTKLLVLRYVPCQTNTRMSF